MRFRHHILTVSDLQTSVTGNALKNLLMCHSQHESPRSDSQHGHRSRSYPYAMVRSTIISRHNQQHFDSRAAKTANTFAAVHLFLCGNAMSHAHIHTRNFSSAISRPLSFRKILLFVVSAGSETRFVYLFVKTQRIVGVRCSSC
jgi:hypothetical protein